MNKPPDTQPNASAHRRIPFWRIVGAALVGGLLISLAAMLIGPGFSGRARPEAARAPSEAARAWSDALCASAFLVALGSALPILFDAGRGVAMLGKLVPRVKTRHESWFVLVALLAGVIFYTGVVGHNLAVIGLVIT